MKATDNMEVLMEIFRHVSVSGCRELYVGWVSLGYYLKGARRKRGSISQSQTSPYVADCHDMLNQAWALMSDLPGL